LHFTSVINQREQKISLPFLVGRSDCEVKSFTNEFDNSKDCNGVSDNNKQNYYKTCMENYKYSENKNICDDALFNLGDDFTFPSNFSVEGIIDRATAYVDSVETKSGIGLENKKLKNKKFSSKLIRKIKINKGKQKKTHRKKVMDMDPNVASVVLTDVTPVLLEKSQAVIFFWIFCLTQN
jgi:hypothetical protein